MASQVPPSEPFNPFTNPEPLLTTLARLFAYEGKAAHVAVLTFSRPSIEQTDYDNWDGGIDIYTLYLYVSALLYAQVGDKDREGIEKDLYAKAISFLDDWRGHRLSRIRIMPEMTTDQRWRERVAAWLAGSGVTNQGRVRSDNIAALSCDGLLFRSQPEIFLYQALKSLGVCSPPGVRSGRGVLPSHRARFRPAEGWGTNGC
ncbi:MAG: hypothetical protein KJZ78_16210 [Bryobacteraceae bacterium]|nr:hypothetical protein [Bryobacteraceae bacterium]